jgi:hypothetical protein
MGMFRTPRTRQEKRAAATALEVEGLAKTTRIKRRQGRGLPTEWEDQYPTSTNSWKHHRRTQYRAASIGNGNWSAGDRKSVIRRERDLWLLCGWQR